jgi:hypothetical protein
MWEAIAYVSSGVTLVAFVAGAAVFAYRASLKREEEIIKTAPEQDRVAMAERVLERFHVETHNLTKERQYEIAMEQIRNRLRLAMIWATVVVIIVVLGAIVLIVALLSGGGKGPVAPPQAFVYQACEGYDDTRLPDDLLGSLQDDKEKPRVWMMNTEDAACQSLGAKCSKLWLLTDEFADSYVKFTLLVNVGTDKDVAIEACLVQYGDPKRIPLRQTERPGPGPLYRYRVPQSEKGSRLLVFVGMKENIYDSIRHDPRFRMASSP